MVRSSVKTVGATLLVAGALALLTTAPAAAREQAPAPVGQYRVHVAPEALLRTSGMRLGAYARLSDAIEAARAARGDRRPVVIAAGLAADDHWLRSGNASFYEVYVT